MLDSQPDMLTTYQARPENWMRPMDAPTPVKLTPAPIRQLQLRRAGVLGALASRTLITQEDQQTASDIPFKLFQPSHLRYYLVTASLVCQEIGMPDRVIDSTAQEKTSFVVRRMMLKNPTAFGLNNPAPSPDENPSLYDEYAFVEIGGAKAWQKLTNVQLLATNEEQNPLFAVNFTQSDTRRRRLFGGLVPTGKRDAYHGAAASADAQAALPAPSGQTPTVQDPRLEFQARRVFFGPWQQLVENMFDLVDKCEQDLALDSSGNNQTSQRQLLGKTRLRLQESSWYLLLDFANFLADQLPNLIAVLEAGSNGSSLTYEKPLFDALNAVKLYKDSTIDIAQTLQDQYGVKPLDSLGAALGKIRKFKPQLEAATSAYNKSGRGVDWPDFLFPLVDVASANCDAGNAAPYLSIVEPSPFTPYGSTMVNAGAFVKEIESLLTVLLSVLPYKSATPLPPVPLNGLQPTRIAETGWFVIRCVFERPNCLPSPTPLLSDPTSAFQIAGFFDPDAPARPLRIDLPIDTSPAGLRKFDKNTAFLVSDMLCGQVKRARSLGLGDLIRSVLPFPLHKDLDVSNDPCQDGANPIGMICSLSIPIITICAFILLMVIVSLLDFIFRWIPYFILCFPLPKFTAKEGS